MQRTTLKVAGESGSGLLSTGSILMRALKRQGFYLNADREYPSLIKGGHANYQIDFAPYPIHSLSTEVDAILAVDRIGLKDYIDRVKPGGIMIHGDERYKLIMPSIEKRAAARNVRLVYLPARQIAYSFGGNELMTNMVLLGLTWKILGFPLKELEGEVQRQFASKPKLLAIDLKCIEAGYAAEGIDDLPDLSVPQPAAEDAKKAAESMLIDGNTAIGLGVIQAGVRAYYAYPMSPSSSILSYLAKAAHETGMLVKQGEDEITVAQMTSGSMFMGTRALCATSGGGFDLMTETVSMNGIIENPFVCVICQRPGPGTGLPTWSAQGDLNLASYSAHGEFPRVVIGCSDPTSCYELIQHAFNVAEKYQVVVLVLSEKVIAETQLTVEPFQQNVIPIERGIVTEEKRLQKLEPHDRYKITESGLSERWLPGTSPAYYFANGDEHEEDGSITEEADKAAAMIAKRLRKESLVVEALPEPVIYGAKSNAQVSFIGWGSTKNVMLDVISCCRKQGISVNYLHYEYLFPLKTEVAKEFFKENDNVCLIEGNALGQLGNMVEAKTGCQFVKRFLKYDGRPFFFQEVLDFIDSFSSAS